jgi:sigma-B regulation protein RsbQ
MNAEREQQICAQPSSRNATMDREAILERNNVKVGGSPHAARTLVLVHGFGTDQRAWAPIVEALIGECRIVLLDQAGAGESDRASFAQHRYLNLHQYAADLVEVCEALDLRDAVFIGHSVGAMTCALAALKQPRLCARLVLIGASARYLNDAGYHGGFSEDALNQLYRNVLDNFSAWTDAFAPMVMANADQPALAQHFATTIRSIPREQVFTVLCSIFQSDHRADVCQLDKPTLLIQARDDIAVPIEAAEFLHRSIRGSELRLIDASGHLPHVSAPGAVLDAMRDFVLA